MAKHKYVKHVPPCSDEDRCLICYYDVHECEVCGMVESWLPTECPGVPIPFGAGERIGQGKLDFINGQWVNK